MFILQYKSQNLVISGVQHCTVSREKNFLLQKLTMLHDNAMMCCFSKKNKIIFSAILFDSS